MKSDIEWKPFSLYKTDGLWWFRVYGYGLHWKNISKHGLLFSERTNPKRKVNLIIKNWKITILTRRV